MCRKIKTTVLFMSPASWSTDLSSFYYSGINLFLTDYVCYKLCNIWLLLFENNSRIYHYTGASQLEKKTFLQLLLKIGWYMTIWPFKRQSHKMVKHIQKFVDKLPTNCLNVFDHFVKLALKRWKRQIKNRTLYTCRLSLLTRIFQYISNWSEVFEHLPILFL